MKKPIMFAGIAAVALLAVGYFVLLPMFKGKPAAEAADDDEPVAAASAHSSSSATKKKKSRAAEPGLVYPITERILNLASSGGQAHYARIELALEFEKPAAHGKAAAPAKHAEPAGKEAPLDPALEPVAARKAQIDDLVLRIVGGKTFEQMTTNDGREELKQEILDGVLDLVPTMELLNVYIVRLVVQ